MKDMQQEIRDAIARALAAGEVRKVQILRKVWGDEVRVTVVPKPRVPLSPINPMPPIKWKDL